MKVGLQVYTVRKHLADNPRKTLEQVVKAGYKGIEFANHTAEKDVGIGFGYSKEEMKSIIKDLEIDVVGAHVMPSDHDDVMWFYEDLEYFKKFIDYFVELGAKNISIPHITFDSKDQLLNQNIWNIVLISHVNEILDLEYSVTRLNKQFRID